ncbi:MAG: putative quinol monooxygenase, partial [Gemmatimonadota bacterium]
LLRHATGEQESDMYGRIGKIVAAPGERDALADILLENAGEMPGCLSYVVAADAEDPDTLWVTEVWESEEKHRASLSRAAVQDAMERGRPLIEAIGEGTTTAPLGGHGLVGG